MLHIPLVTDPQNIFPVVRETKLYVFTIQVPILRDNYFIKDFIYEIKYIYTV